jgi:hypothetical protein
MTRDETLRRQLGATVTGRLRPEIPGISAHIGEDYQEAGDPEAALYRRIGAHFHWVAFAFAPWRMWDLHVGVVATEGKQLSIGFHISERAKALLLQDLQALGNGIGAKAEHRPAAVEYQANLPLVNIDFADTEGLARTITDLCRKMAPLAERIEPSSDMRAA